jgi:hypothetical protein
MFVRVLTGLLIVGAGLALFGWICFKAGQQLERSRRSRVMLQWQRIVQPALEWRRFEREDHPLQSAQALNDLRIALDQEEDRLSREFNKLTD